MDDFFRPPQVRPSTVWFASENPNFDPTPHHLDRRHDLGNDLPSRCPGPTTRVHSDTDPWRDRYRRYQPRMTSDVGSSSSGRHGPGSSSVGGSTITVGSGSAISGSISGSSSGSSSSSSSGSGSSNTRGRSSTPAIFTSPATRAAPAAAAAPVSVAAAAVAASDRARNRANQAASRARTRARLAALEEQVARHEAAGIAATVEVQRAARGVADENARLRELISRLGVSDVQLAAWLERGEVPVRSPQAPPPPQAPSRSPPPAVDARRGSSSELRHGGRRWPDVVVSVYGGPARTQGACECQKAERKRRRVEGQEGQDGPNEEASGEDVTERETAMDETACEDAAMIIASMRGGGRTEEIWSEMGCGRSRTCLVKNSHIFDLAGSTSED